MAFHLKSVLSPLRISVMHRQLVYLDKINAEHFKSSVGLVFKHNMRNSTCKRPNELRHYYYHHHHHHYYILLYGLCL